jgi:5-methyltetrahydrofolate--homocysteine methyltransferase
MGRGAHPALAIMPDYALLNQLLYEGKAPEVKRLTEEALAEGRLVDEVLEDGLIAGMNVVGEDFKHDRLYVPQVLVAARAMKAGLAVLKPLLASSGSVRQAGTVVMGTVKGDLHDIGKNLVCMMAEGAGVKVVDLGVDQPAQNFLAAAREHGAQIVGMSALLTTTMTYMKTVIDAFRAEGMGHVRLCVGGAPVSRMFAEEIGADGYAGDAASAVELFQSLCPTAASV